MGLVMLYKVDLKALRNCNEQIKKFNKPNLLNFKKQNIKNRNNIIRSLHAALTNQNTSFRANFDDDSEHREVIAQNNGPFDNPDYYDSDENLIITGDNYPLMSTNQPITHASYSASSVQKIFEFDLNYSDALYELFSSLDDVEVPLTAEDFDSFEEFTLINNMVDKLRFMYQNISDFRQTLKDIDTNNNGVSYYNLYEKIISNIILLNNVKPMGNPEFDKVDELNAVYNELHEYTQACQNTSPEDISQKLKELNTKQNEVMLKAHSSLEFRQHMQTSLTNVISDNDTSYREMYDSCYEYLNHLNNEPEQNSGKIQIMGLVMTYLTDIAINHESAAENTKAMLETIYKNRKTLFADKSNATNFFIKAVAQFVVFCLDNKLIGNTMLNAINSYYTSSLFKSLKPDNSISNENDSNLDNKDTYNPQNY